MGVVFYKKIAEKVSQLTMILVLMTAQLTPFFVLASPRVVASVNNSNHVAYWCGDYDGGVKFDNNTDDTKEAIVADFDILDEEPENNFVNLSSTTKEIKKVVVNGGGSDEEYESSPWLELVAPLNTNTQNNEDDTFEISHVIVCYDEIAAPTGSIKVSKKVDLGQGYVDDNPSSYGFMWGLDGETSDRTMGSTQEDVAVGDHTVHENVNSVDDFEFTGWYNTTSSVYNCDNPKGTTLPINTTVNENQVRRITLCNKQDEAPHTINVTVKKYIDTDGDGNTNRVAGDGEFSFRLNDGAFIPYSGGADGVVFENVPVGSHAIAESDEDGYTFYGADGISCDYPSDFTDGVWQFTVTEESEDIECSFFNRADQEEPVDFCDPADRPSGMSIGEWLTENQTNGLDCFELTEVEACGSFDVTFRNETPLHYEVRYIIGDSIPTLNDWEGDGVLPVNFDEDEYGGSVEVTYYIVGAEGDYLVETDLPNIWDGEGVTVEVDTDCEQPIDFCDPTDRPSGMSIAHWLRVNEVDVSDCFELEVMNACGVLDVSFNDKTELGFEVRYAIGNSTPALSDWEGDGVLPAYFDEDENGGSVNVTYYVVGPESDYFVGSGFPNIWDDNGGARVAVDTDCLGINIVKDGPASAEAGSTVTYTFTVTNVGDKALGEITVVDSITGDATYVSGDSNVDTYLNLDETWVFETEYTIPDNQVEPVNNTAEVCGFEREQSIEISLEDVLFRQVSTLSLVEDNGIVEEASAVCDDDSHTLTIPQVLGATTTATTTPQVLGATTQELAPTGNSHYGAILTALLAIGSVYFLRRETS